MTTVAFLNKDCLIIVIIILFVKYFNKKKEIRQWLAKSWVDNDEEWFLFVTGQETVKQIRWLLFLINLIVSLECLEQKFIKRMSLDSYFYEDYILEQILNILKL